MRLKEKYNQIVPKLSEKLGKKNLLAIPRITKVVINAGIGKFKDDKGLIESVIKDISLIAGQKANPTRAKKAISNFKIRAHDVVGVSVTLRGPRMWAFLDKLINIALPRVRDFRGVKKTSFDQKGSYTLGLREHVVFPEINPNTVDKIKSLEITIVTTSRNKEESFVLLEALGMPFEKGK